MPEDGLPSLEPGDVVRSLKGRDRGNVSLVWGVLTEQRVALVDGEMHPLARPKPKNRRHLVRLGHHKELASRMATARISDSDLRQSLAPYRKAAQTLGGSVGEAVGTPVPAASGNENGSSGAARTGLVPAPNAAGSVSAKPTSGDGPRKEGEGDGTRG